MKRKLILFVVSLLFLGSVSAQENHWSFNVNDYSDNMPFIGKVSIDGVVQNSSDIEVASFVGDQVRSVDRLFEILPGEYFAWIQIAYSSLNETVSFKIYNHATGVEMDNCPITVLTCEDGYGDLFDPIMLDFTTGYVFIGSEENSNWSVASNWQGNQLPTEDGDVIINGICVLDVDATVASLVVNDNMSITISAGMTLTAEEVTSDDATKLIVADGGQLVYGNTGVQATVQKEIAGYGTGDDNWYFIASPLADNVDYTTVDNMNANVYDLYAFDQTGGEDYLEWRNFKLEGNDQTLAPGQGYLYANSEDVVLGFAGELNTTVTSVPLEYIDGYRLSGWNLIGNPFTYNVYADRSYYQMDADGVAIDPTPMSAGNPIAPCMGIMMKVMDEGETVVFSQSPADKQRGYLQMTVSSSNRGAASDRAMISFNAGDELAKFVFNENSLKLYIPQEGEERAIVSASDCGEMPVNFKAAANGAYTFSINEQEVEMAYLHLIDNLTGADVDLLETPAYSFNATTADYESRFTLVFAMGNNGDSFAFFNNGNLVVNNEGVAVLQVLDVNGRMISAETINGSFSKSFNVSAGVYMLRLINGNDVKTQKIVIK